MKEYKKKEGFRSQAIQPVSENPEMNSMEQVLQRYKNSVGYTEENGALSGESIGSGSQKINNTGLPTSLKERVEKISGFSMDDVRVHYRSDKPAELQALAYTHGTDIYIGPGQEQYLSHELWHVVQQKQRRVNPEIRKKDLLLNNNDSLEKEADSWTTMNSMFYGHPTDINTLPLPVIQCYLNEEPYSINGKKETRYLQARGAGAKFIAFAKERKNLGILYEVIARPNEGENTINRFRTQFAGKDSNVALSIVLNTPGLPSQPGEVRQEINDPLIHIEEVKWGMKKDGGGRCIYNESDKGEVPYYTLRRRAAVNDGSKQLYQLLGGNEGKVWRRMGDDDLTFHDPSQIVGEDYTTVDGKLPEQDIQMQILSGEIPPEEIQSQILKQKNPQLEDKKCSEFYSSIKSKIGSAVEKKMITFGYNLTTPGENNVTIQQLTKCIYKYEMAFREEKCKEGVPAYPIEPTTYYKMYLKKLPAESTSSEFDPSLFNTALSERLYVNQQIKEGLTIKEILDVAPEWHLFLRVPSENTSAGGRHTELVEYLKQILERGFNIDNDIESLISYITKLSQSYFNPSTLGLNEEDTKKHIEQVKKFLKNSGFFTEFTKLLPQIIKQ